MLVSGSSVRGGLAGEHPGVTSVDDDGDLADHRLPHRLPVADRRVARRRPERRSFPAARSRAWRRYDGGTRADEVMHRALALLALAVAAAASVLPAQAVARRHRLHLPPVDLPRALTVDETEWAVQPSKTLVARRHGHDQRVQPRPGRPQLRDRRRRRNRRRQGDADPRRDGDRDREPTARHLPVVLLALRRDTRVALRSWDAHDDHRPVVTLARMRALAAATAVLRFI